MLQARRYVASIAKKRLCRLRYIGLYALIVCSYFALCHLDLMETVSAEEEFIRYFENDRNYFYVRDVDMQIGSAGNDASVKILTSYYDDRIATSEPFVRIFASSHSKSASVFCCFRVAEFSTWVCSKWITRPKVLSSRIFNESKNGTRTVHELMVCCKIYKSKFDRGHLTHVTLVIVNDKVANRISDTSAISRYVDRDHMTNKSDYTVCIIPYSVKLRGVRFSETQDLVEYIEVLRLLGSSQIISYYNNSSVVTKFLKHVIGISVEFVQSSEEIRDIVLYPTIAKNDCIYRSLHRSKYVIFLDINEILVPTLARDWSQMFTSLENIHNTTKVGSYIIQVFDFYDETTNSTASYGKGSHSGSIHASRKPQKHKYDLKYLPRLVRFRTREKNASSDSLVLVQPDKFDYVTGAGSTKMLPGFLQVNVPVDFGTVHRFIHGQRKLKGLVIDASQDKFVPTLLRKLHILGYGGG